MVALVTSKKHCFSARLGLFVTALTAATEHCFPGMVTACTGVESQYFSLYWYKLLTASCE